MEQKEMTMDDLFKIAENLSKKLHEFSSQKGFEEKVAAAMMEAKDPDSMFKADIAVKLSTVLNLMDMFITYMNKPVKKEGILQRKLDGSVMLDDYPVPSGSLVEYWMNDKWNIGKIQQNSQTKQSQIIDTISGKVHVDKIEQLEARIR